MNAKPNARQEILKQFGERLRFLRNERGLSQEALAAEAGFSRSYYSEIELGKRNISLLNLCKLAKCFHISLRELADLDLPECD